MFFGGNINFLGFYSDTSPGFRSRGDQNHKGGNIFKCNIGCIQQPGAKHEMGGTDFKWRAGHTGPPLPLSTELFLLYDNTFFLVCNLGLFEITEWEPSMFFHYIMWCFCGYSSK